jgi:hypothetical protein
MERVFLHICCGPCATHVIESLVPDYAVTGYFYNPNIHPAEEYRSRLGAALEVCARLRVPFVEEPPDHTEFREAVLGLEGEPENGARCLVCYRFRLERTARVAAWSLSEYMATTLTLGPMKKAAVINPIGVEEARRAGVRFLEADWKKHDGFRRSCELSREFGIYRQHYCGCEFSMRHTPSEEGAGDVSVPDR